MRELLSTELAHIAGASLYSDYSTEEIVPVSATIGHSIGVFINTCHIKNYQSSVSDLTNAITNCRKMLKGVQGVVPLPFLKTRAANAIFYFGCGIYLTLATARKNATSGGGAEL